METMDGGRSQTSLILIVVGVLAIVVALFVGGAMVMTGSMMGGGMMGGGLGGRWWPLVIVVLAIGLGVVALAFAFRSPLSSSTPAFSPLPPQPIPPPSIAPIPPTSSSSDEAARLERLQEAAIVKALDEDERRLYLQIREAGGTALQRDLVASGAFSKAKVTRLLDKLERRGLVVRERYGATNRVKLTWKGPPAA
jgi:hypothetical protein